MTTLMSIGTPAVKPTDDGSAGQPRADLRAAIGLAPAEVRRLILGPCRDALDLVHAYLPASEQVSAILPLKPVIMDGTTNSLLILTNWRLVFVAPAPQAISWPLTDVTKFQYVVGGLGSVIVHAAGGEFMLGGDHDVGPYGTTFGAVVKSAVTVAILSQRMT